MKKHAALARVKASHPWRSTTTARTSYTAWMAAAVGEMKWSEARHATSR